MLFRSNPQMKALEQLKGEFEATHPDIKVNLLILPENEIRAKVTTDVATGAGTFDLITVGMYEVPLWAKQGWIDEVGTTLDADPAYDSADFFQSIRDGLSFEGKLYAAPFYGESSSLFYRKDLFAAAGITLPVKPTWDDVVAAAAKLHKPDQGQYGICLRGLPGWGEQGAPLGTVINTFGGRWYDAGWNAQVTSQQTTDAIKFYIDTVQKYGEPDAIKAGFTECETLMVQGKVAMWYDATVAAGLLEADDSPVKGKNGFALAPTKVTEGSGWLWAWALAIPQNAPDPDTAWQYVSWATGPDYLVTAGENLAGGWAAVPPGTRQSLYANENYQAAASAFAQKTLDAMLAAPINNPGTKPRPGLPGVQFVGVPEFQDVGTRCTEEFSAVIAGNKSIDDALAACQAIASEVSN